MIITWLIKDQCGISNILGPVIVVIEVRRTAAIKRARG